VLGQPGNAFLPVREAILRNQNDQKVLQSGEPITLEELGQQLRDMDIIIPYGIMRPLATNDNFN